MVKKSIINFRNHFSFKHNTHESKSIEFLASMRDLRVSPSLSLKPPESFKINPNIIFIYFSLVNLQLHKLF
jgi:hypothetical protein